MTQMRKLATLDLLILTNFDKFAKQFISEKDDCRLWYKDQKNIPSVRNPTFVMSKQTEKKDLCFKRFEREKQMNHI